MQLEGLDGEKLVDELAAVVRMIGGKPTEAVKRLRFAVTQEERDAIKNYLFKRQPGTPFYGMIKGVTLVVDVDPTDPACAAEWQDQ